MGLEAYQVKRDHFEPEESTYLCFPCSACRHRHTASCLDEPCVRCDWNAAAKPDYDLPPNAK
jgi:hypothetical protein